MFLLITKIEPVVSRYLGTTLYTHDNICYMATEATNTIFEEYTSLFDTPTGN